MVCFIESSEFFIFVETESTVCDSKKSRGTAFVFFFKRVGGPRTAKKTSRRCEASKRTDRVESFVEHVGPGRDDARGASGVDGGTISARAPRTL